MTTPDYRATVFLPRTDFPMKAGLAQSEPATLARWQAARLYDRLRAERAGRERFILHDGPPYANGDMHVGHALNHVLKDMVVRQASLAGRDAPYIPGWDCHGLPIEWKVEEEFRAQGRRKGDVPAAEFRARCRAFAAHWVGVQREQLERLGVWGDWDHPYLTMDYAAEATIARELMKFAESGQVYRGAKPVMWSPVEQTALAEAEVEYEDIVSTQVDVAFKLTHVPNAPELEGAYAVIWTTTPWTLPVNKAIAFGAEVEYVVAEVGSRRLVIAKELAGAALFRSLGNDPEQVMGVVQAAADAGGATQVSGSALTGALAQHPLAGTHPFFDEPRPLLAGDFVTTDQGTGLVHMAPDHGEDDFLLCKEYGLGPEFAVGADGTYRADWPLVGGQHVYKVNAPDGPICSAIRDAGGLLAASADYRHSYPHSWRSKAKLIFRCTPQWFIAMDTPLLRTRDEGARAPAWEGEGPSTTGQEAGGPPPRSGEDHEDPPRHGEGDHGAAMVEGPTLRVRALTAIADTRWIPPQGENRIRAMVENRPDWVLSRQRAWGVPITLFVDRATGDYLRDPEVNARIASAIEQGGADAWWTADRQALLGDAYEAADYEQVWDILDVWFDSGCTHAFVTEARLGAEQADLVLEGSDQHRGWFQSSLLESCGTRGVAPYKAVLTHGFTLDANGRKMSKSQGNTVDPNKIIGEHGADVLRLWVATSDFTEDQRIGPAIVAQAADTYRKLRNTLRYLLGALDGFTDAERVPVADMPELERWTLHRLAELDAEWRGFAGSYAFNRQVSAVAQFCNADLSAFLFDIRKDVLYCAAGQSPERRAYRTVLDVLFATLVKWLAPVLVFTAEEAWTRRHPGAPSVHLGEYAPVDPGWLDPVLGAKWERIRELRKLATEAIEIARKEKRIGSSNQAEVEMTAAPPDAQLLASVDMTEVAIASSFAVQPGKVLGVAVTVSADPRCARCWRHRADVAPETELCARCAAVVGA